jgi:hypothetical protein
VKRKKQAGKSSKYEEENVWFLLSCKAAGESQMDSLPECDLINTSLSVRSSARTLLEELNRMIFSNRTEQNSVMRR